MSRRVLVAGETVIDLIPTAPEQAESGDRFIRRAGGAPANVAVGLARLGCPPWLWTRLGTDPMGEYLAGVLTENDIPERFVERDPDGKTTLAVVSYDDSGDRSFTFYQDTAADTRFVTGRVPDSALEPVDWVVIGGIALTAEPSRTAILDLARRARAMDCTVVFDPNTRPELSGPAFERTVRDTLKHTHVLKASTADLRAVGFSGADPVSLARAACVASVHTVVVTLGADGAVFVSRRGAPWGATTVSHPGYTVDAVDTTGAGDGFLAGLLAGCVEGNRSPEKLLDIATAAGGHTVTTTGAMTALPTRNAIESLRKTHE
ncbi:carbohydrate kinase family protein [Halocatena pleomorpha]|uniref:Carbohydrate kinase n=1 Tax=Halocatena pleomorpha TaxID=1785090 RepID=A0A3P3R476_9EURY|nr:carbohydrate kinase [Halocatena pleomorpha]RRJ27679.1 carbohydrate kinase [Halocatena pleomorpha]